MAVLDQPPSGMFIPAHTTTAAPDTSTTVVTITTVTLVAHRSC